MEAGPRAAFEGKARLVAGQIDSVGWVVAACVEPFALVMRRNVLTVHTLLLWQPAPAILAASVAIADALMVALGIPPRKELYGLCFEHRCPTVLVLFDQPFYSLGVRLRQSL